MPFTANRLKSARQLCASSTSQESLSTWAELAKPPIFVAMLSAGHRLLLCGRIVLQWPYLCQTLYCTDLKSQNFIRCHIHANEYFGGVTRISVSDNLRARITKNTRYETIIPQTYNEIADHYMYITVKMYPCSGGTDTGSPGL